jgi:hypothetical protein
VSVNSKLRSFLPFAIFSLGALMTLGSRGLIAEAGQAPPPPYSEGARRHLTRTPAKPGSLDEGMLGDRRRVAENAIWIKPPEREDQSGSRRALE